MVIWLKFAKSWREQVGVVGTAVQQFQNARTEGHYGQITAEKFKAVKSKNVTLRVVSFWHLLLQEAVETVSAGSKVSWIYELQLHEWVLKVQGRLALSNIPNSGSLDAGGGYRL